jgi:hypothetical protein
LLAHGASIFFAAAMQEMMAPGFIFAKVTNSITASGVIFRGIC